MKGDDIKIASDVEAEHNKRGCQAPMVVYTKCSHRRKKDNIHIQLNILRDVNAAVDAYRVHPRDGRSVHRQS